MKGPSGSSDPVQAGIIIVCQTYMADPWEQHVTLRKMSNDDDWNNQMVNLTEYRMPPWDVASLKIKADLPARLDGVEVTCGGAPLISYTVDMLRKLKVVDGWMEILTPHIGYLPTSRLFFHEANVVFRFAYYGKLPTVEVRMQRRWPPPMSIPLSRPVDGIAQPPVLFTVAVGMGYYGPWDGKPYGLPYRPRPPKEQQDDGPASVGAARAAAASD